MTSFVDSGALRAAWHPIAESSDVSTERPLAVTLLGAPLVSWRDPNESVVVAHDRCPHRQAPLSIGTASGGVLTCAYHGWSFGASGRCVGIPSAGHEGPVAPAAHLQRIEVVERYGLVWVRLNPGTGEIPAIPQEHDPAFRRINSGMQTWRVSAPRMVDNFCDVSHFPWVHRGTFGTEQDPIVAPIALADLGDGWFGYRYDVEVDNPDVAAVSSGASSATVHRRMSTGFDLPFSVRSTISYDSGLEHILLLCSTPIDDETSLFTFVVWRNDDHTVDPEEAIAFDRAIGEEDRRLLEQIDGTMPLGRTDLVSVQADRASVEWRRRFATMLER